MSDAQKSKVALITGTSSGIGLETAIALASDGWITVATLRAPARAVALTAAAERAGVHLDIRALDVTDADGAASVIESVVAEYGSLDALVNNAGAAAVGTAELLALDDFRASMEVNFFGVVTLTQAALPHLRAARGRLVTVSSVGGIVGQPFNEAYCAAKFAVEGFLESLHPVAAQLGVRVTVVEPAAVASDFVANAGIDPVAALANAGVYREALGAYLARTAAAFDPATAQTSASAADAIRMVLAADMPPFRVQTSAAATAFVGLKLSDLDGSAVTGLTSTWIAQV